VGISADVIWGENMKRGRKRSRKCKKGENVKKEKL
jgi:hypothetical protein